MALNWLQKRAVLIAVLMILMGVTLYLTLKGWGFPGKLDEFAQCVSATGAKVYTKLWDEPSNQQMGLFGNSKRYLNEVNCSAKGGLEIARECITEHIERFPTWSFSYSGKIEGLISLEDIAQKSGCVLPE